eukprot:TRINITY_DN4402_c0_g2_i1.p1 TRINITY_DN4402_c0_g2~~TRINITY_DN4402_c0_g2_i1.p1  ORF type:complete len:608 (-),score=66.67 TRINITY_DN4402_c0_g2_i1:23-1846(-)
MMMMIIIMMMIVGILLSFSGIVANALFVDNDENVSTDQSDVRDDAGACSSVVEQRDIEFLSDAIKQIFPDAPPPRSAQDVAAGWAKAQYLLYSHAFPGYPRTSVLSPVSILIVQALKFASLELFISNLHYVGGLTATTIKWAHFYYDSRAEDWNNIGWYRNDPDIIVRKNIPRGTCEYVHFSMLEPGVASLFDYVWLLDEDVDLRYMNFNLYHLVLKSLSPVVSQPSVLLGAVGGKSSLLPGIPTRLAVNNHFVVAAENELSEVMTPFISTKIWPALRQWMSRKTSICDSDVSMFWDVGAMLKKLYCKSAGTLIVNAAPVSHIDCRSNTDAGKCWHNCGDDMAKPMNQEEARLLGQVCPLIPPDWLVRHGCDRLSLTDCLHSLRQAGHGDHTWSVPLPKAKPVGRVQFRPAGASPVQPGRPVRPVQPPPALGKPKPQAAKPVRSVQPPPADASAVQPGQPVQPVQSPPAVAQPVPPDQPPPADASPVQPGRPVQPPPAAAQPVPPDQPPPADASPVQPGRPVQPPPAVAKPVPPAARRVRQLVERSSDDTSTLRSRNATPVELVQEVPASPANPSVRPPVDLGSHTRIPSRSQGTKKTSAGSPWFNQ